MRMYTIIRNVATNTLKVKATNQEIKVGGDVLRYAMGVDPHLFSAANRAWIRVVGIVLLFVNAACQAGNSMPKQQIAFETERQGDFIYVMNADGTGQTRRTLSPLVQDAHPTWSPDGKQIAFENGVVFPNYEIDVIDADGNGKPTPLAKGTGHFMQPAWSPNGKQIAFVSDREGDVEIYLMNSDGSGVKNITNSPGKDWQPAWSADGQHIAFSSARDGNYEIYVMNADGTGQKNLTQNDADDITPAWSPDGKHIAFVSARDNVPPENCPPEPCNLEIYLMNPNGSGLLRLTNNPHLDLSPAWKP